MCFIVSDFIKIQSYFVKYNVKHQKLPEVKFIESNCCLNTNHIIGWEKRNLNFPLKSFRPNLLALHPLADLEPRAQQTGGAVQHHHLSTLTCSY